MFNHSQIKSNIIIKIEKITKEYDDFKLDEFSLRLESGKLFGILGPNGSGKSTVIKILTGQILPTKGEIEILGISPINKPIEVKEVIGIIPEQEIPPSFLTINEYLEFVANIRKLKNVKSKINKWLSFLELQEDKNCIIKNLSRGTKQKVLFAQAFIHNPKVVFIDEPLINLDPLMQKKIKEFLKSYVKEGNTVFLSTHILSIAEEICDEICILKYGKTMYKGSIAKIIENNNSLENYFIKLIKNEK